MKTARLRLGACAALALVAVVAGGSSALADTQPLVISQVYGGGGNTGATYANDFIEVFNRGPSTVALTGLSLQYASATGTGNLGANDTQLTELSGTLAPGQYFLVQEASGGATGVALPTADVVDATPINMSASGGKVALVSGTSSLGCNGGSAPCDGTQLARIQDLIGYDGADFFEGDPAPALTNTTAAIRLGGGCTDTDINADNFTAATPTPRNTSSPLNFCTGDAAPTVSSHSPSSAATNVAVAANVTVTFSEPVDVASGWYTISCATSGAHTATVSGGPTTFTLDPDSDFAHNETCTVTITGADVSDQDTLDPPDNIVGNPSWSFTTVAEAVSTSPTLVMAANPASGSPGTLETVTGTVTPGTNPASTGTTVSCDLSVFGQGASAQLHDDGLNGDATAGDNVFTIQFTIPGDTTTGTKVGSCTVADGQGRSGTASWSIEVTPGAAPPLVVVSQVYGGGGNSGATLKNDFIELYNRGSTPTSLSGWSVQYGAAAGTTWLVTPLTNFTLQPGQYYLVQEAAGAGGTVNLPTPDATGSINMSATAGKVALVSTTTALTSCADASIVDLVGYGTTANCSETAPTANLSNTTAAVRKAGGATDTNNNSADFDVAAPNPRNSGTADDAPSVVGRSPAAGASDVPVNANVTVTFSEPVDVTGAWYTLNCTTSGAHTATAIGGPTTFTLDPDSDFTAAETCTVTIVAANVSDQDTNDPPDTMAANDTWSFTTVAPPVAIHDIQGASHISPLNGQNVSGVQGIVTAKRSNGYYVEDPSPDANDATSEGIFVFTSSTPAVNVGDAVKVAGKVQEFRPGGASSTNLTTTELTSPTTTLLSTGNPLPAPVVVGSGGRIPPNTVIEDDATGDVETSGTFDPAGDGLDFWESLEGMRLQLNNAVAVGPTNSFGETQVVGDDGANASVRTARGGLLLRPNDANPERLVADDAIVSLPAMNVGDHYAAPLVGVLDYNFGNFFLEVTSSVGAVHNGVTPETTSAAGLNQISIGTFNFENLAPSDPQSKFDRLAALIVTNLASPDLLSGEEVQDNSGATDNGVVAADQTLAKLVAAIQAAGGPTYDWRQIDPVNDQDGGQPGGNIRQVFLFRTDRGLSFVDRPGGGSTTADSVVGTGASTQLAFSPGRIDPTNSAWNTSRKPLAGEFLFNGHHLFVIANHFNSKGGDQPLEGHFQPPTRSSEVQRHQQAQLVHDFVASILSADPNANVVVDGDLNDFEFSDTVHILESGVLTDLMDTLPQNERYSYVFEGNSQTLDHILIGGALTSRPWVFDPVHVNAEFADQASDHDPSVVRITLNDAPSASAGGPYAVDEGSSLQLAGTGTDPEGGPLTYAWDLDNNGTFETTGQNVTFSAPDGPATRTVNVRVTDDGGLADNDSATITIANVPPTATFNAPASAPAGFAFDLSLASPQDPSSADTAAGFTYAFDCGSGFGAFDSASGVSCPTSDVETRSVGAKIRDKDGGVTEYHATVQVFVTFSTLCDLVKAYSTDPKVAEDLCAKLATAEAASTATARDGALSSFRNQVDAKVDKGLTAAQAAELKLLSLRL